MRGFMEKPCNGILFAEGGLDLPTRRQRPLVRGKQIAQKIKSSLRAKGIEAPQDVVKSIQGGLSIATSLVSDTYNATLSWKNNSEFSRWLTDHFSNQHATIASKAMDAEYLRTHVGGAWHRLYDHGHTLAGSWKAVSESLPDLNTFDQLGRWANEYWKDLITAYGMPLVVLDHTEQISEYLKHLDCINVAQDIGGGLIGVSIYCNWNDPDKLIASASSNDCSGLVYANVVAPLVSLIGISRACYLLKKSQQNDLRKLVAPALKGLTRGASILLVTAIPGGFLLHLSSGIVINLAHGYLWEKGSENRDELFATLKECLGSQRHRSPELVAVT